MNSLKTGQAQEACLPLLRHCHMLSALAPMPPFPRQAFARQAKGGMALVASLVPTRMRRSGGATSQEQELHLQQQDETTAGAGAAAQPCDQAGIGNETEEAAKTPTPRHSSRNTPTKRPVPVQSAEYGDEEQAQGQPTHLQAADTSPISASESPGQGGAASVTPRKKAARASKAGASGSKAGASSSSMGGAKGGHRPWHALCML